MLERGGGGVPASSRNAPVYACKVDLDGNCNNPNPLKVSYAAGLRTNTAKASWMVTRLHLLPLLPEIENKLLWVLILNMLNIKCMRQCTAT